MVYLCISEVDVGIIFLVLWTTLTIIVTADLLRFRFKGVAREPYENLPSTRVLDARERAGGESQLPHFTGSLVTQDSVNGVVWHIPGVIFAVSLYPQAVQVLHASIGSLSPSIDHHNCRSSRLPCQIFHGVPIYASEGDVGIIVSHSLDGLGHYHHRRSPMLQVQRHRRESVI
jgi:hypothetical protein